MSPRRKSTDLFSEAIAKAETAPKIAPAANTVVTASGQVRPKKTPVTVRLPDDAIAIMKGAIAEEAELGNRLTNDAAVTEALREWGKLRARRR